MPILFEQRLHLVIAEAVLASTQLQLELEHIVYVGQLEDFILEHDIVETSLLARSLRRQVVLAASLPVVLVFQFVRNEIATFALRNHETG